MTGDTDDLALSYVELREVVTDGHHTVDVNANDVNGMVEMWIDPPRSLVPGAEPAAAVANLRWTPDEALAMAAALTAAAQVLKPAGTRKVEILHVRDPDGGCEHVAFVDGERVDSITVEDVDPGRGYLLSDWREATEWVETGADYTEAFRDAVVAERNDAESNQYIEED